MFKKILGLVSVLWFLVSLSNAQEEKITITTYYPSPYGSYNELRSTRMAIGKDYIQGSYVCWQGDTGCDGSYPQVQIPTGPSDPDVDLIVQGNVGIGTTSTDSLTDFTYLDVRGLNGGIIQSASADGIRKVRMFVDGNGGHLQTGTNNPLHLGANGIDYITVLTNGNVGIGTTGPGDKLEIKEGHLRIDGAAPAAYGVRFFRDGIIYGKLATGNNDINLDLVNGADFIVSNGNLGIGTTNPYATLDVNGTVWAQFPRWTMWTDETNGSRTSPSPFTKSSQGAFASYGDIDFSSPTSYYNSYSRLYEMKIYAPSATTVTQKVYSVDDNAYFWLNGIQIASVTGAGAKNVTITWNLVSGINTLQVVINNSVGGAYGISLSGDFFFRYPTLRYVSP